MLKMEWSTAVLPTSEIIGFCNECNTEICRMHYDGYHDHGTKLAHLKKKYAECPNCKAKAANTVKVSPKWKKLDNGDYVAECKKGDFLVWKFGYAYRWRFRTYGKVFADYGGQSYTRKKAQEACERCEEWKEGAL